MFKSVKESKLWQSAIYLLSSAGLLSALGYYLINIENKTLNKPVVVPPVSGLQEGMELGELRGKVVRVVDGDTIKVLLGGDSVTVRLLGIDAPEMAGSPRAAARDTADCMASEATGALKSLLTGGEVTLETDPNQAKYDKYGRLLAYVFTRKDGQQVNINKEMILRGYAHEYTYKGQRYKYQQDFKQAEQKAKLSKLGLWALSVCK